MWLVGLLAPGCRTHAELLNGLQVLCSRMPLLTRHWHLSATSISSGTILPTRLSPKQCHAFLVVSSGGLRAMAWETKDLLESMVYISSKPTCLLFTTLIHAVSNTGRGLDASFHLHLPLFTQL